jgi:NTP pyrophosphatase (non-canonical NTP hydrolase)
MKHSTLLDFGEIQKLTCIDKKTIEQRTLKLTEETGELAQAILSNTNACGCGYKNKSKQDITEECLDVIIVASSIISQNYNNEVDIELIKDIYNKKLIKWKQKCEQK